MENVAAKIRAKIEKLSVEAVKEVIIKMMDSEEEGADAVLAIAIKNLEKRISPKEFYEFSLAV